jgi:NADH-quinone oxidoreductase subunit N
MGPNEFLCLAPYIIIASAPVIIMLTLTVARNLKIIYGFSLFMILSAIVSLFFISTIVPHQVVPLLSFDHFTLLFLALVFGTGFIIIMLSYEYLSHHIQEREEYFIVLFVAILGASVLVAASHFITFFLGLETLSISLYIMIAYLKNRDYSVEAALKFLVIASLATAFLLFGMALVYAATGSMGFTGIAQKFYTSGSSPILLIGTGMMFAGIGFKLALVPFHMWAPDVYQGAPAPVTAFIATLSKGAIIAVALRFFVEIKGFSNPAFIMIITLVAVITMFTGNLLALQQTNLKRLLAYSSIAHMGYLLTTLIMGTSEGIQAALFYLIAYSITTLAVFGAITVLSFHDHDKENITDYRGLFQNNPWIAIILSISMFSLAGIPLTAGFMAKFYLVLAGMRVHLWLLVFSLIINTVISAFYYLRVIKTMFTPSPVQRFQIVSFTGHVILAVLVFAIFLLGILPSLLTDFFHNLAF